MKVLVGLSGGVDSATTALMLKEQGHEVIGATMAIWGNRKIKGMAIKSGRRNACFGPDEKEDIESARRVAQNVGIDYHVFDCAQQYEEIVLKHFKSQYIQGKTPNPCIWCNALVKFGVLPYMARENGINFDKFATGHYARVINENDRYYLYRGIAPNKDQSYFLYRLTQDQLKNIILPLGDFTKDEIRKKALSYGLEVAQKKDSQDFYEGDYNELLEVCPKEGNIVDTEGKILGRHEGIWNYTIGQRKGLGISSDKPLYVLSLDKDKNQVVVGELDKTFKKSLIAYDINLISIDSLSEIKNISSITAKFRSTQQPVSVSVEVINDEIKVIFDDYQKSIAPGQSVVLYDNDKVIGGGIIKSAS